MMTKITIITIIIIFVVVIVDVVMHGPSTLWPDLVLEFKATVTSVSNIAMVMQ